VPSATVFPELRACVQRRVQDGRLPRMHRGDIEAGCGGGAECCACDRPIESEDVEYQVVDPVGGRPLKFHFNCYVLWQEECDSRG
jgi:hypothetical protein